MVAVHHGTTVIHISGSPTTEVELGVASTEDSTTARGEVRYYGDGVRRAVSLEGAEGRLTVTCAWPSLQVAETMRRSFRNRGVTLRDPFGGIFFGLLRSIRKQKSPSLQDESQDMMVLEIDETSHDEEAFL